jgi:hypothetical protein
MFWMLIDECWGHQRCQNHFHLLIKMILNVDFRPPKMPESFPGWKSSESSTSRRLPPSLTDSTRRWIYFFCFVVWAQLSEFRLSEFKLSEFRFYAFSIVWIPIVLIPIVRILNCPNPESSTFWKVRMSLLRVFSFFVVNFLFFTISHFLT